MTEALQAECLARGIPLDIPPTLAFMALKEARRIEITNQRNIAISMLSALGAMFGGKKFTALDAMAHLYSDEEKQEILRSQEETDKRNHSLRMLDKFRAIEDRWDRNGR